MERPSYEAEHMTAPDQFCSDVRKDADLPISGVGSSIFQGHFCSWPGCDSGCFQRACAPGMVVDVSWNQAFTKTEQPTPMRRKRLSTRWNFVSCRVLY